MPSKDVFVSVGSNGRDDQEAFVSAIFDRLRAEGLNPRTLGRTEWNSSAPLKPIKSIIEQCAGAVIIALERTYFPIGVERRGHTTKEIDINEVRLPTPWNQIEAAIAYSKGLPLLVIVEEGLLKEGLLQARYDWFVQSVPVSTEALISPQFTGILVDWKSKLGNADIASDNPPKLDVNSLTIGDLIKALRPNQLWAVAVSGAAMLGVSFALGAKLFGQ